MKIYNLSFKGFMKEYNGKRKKDRSKHKATRGANKLSTLLRELIATIICWITESLAGVSSRVNNLAFMSNTSTCVKAVQEEDINHTAAVIVTDSIYIKHKHTHTLF